MKNKLLTVLSDAEQFALYGLPDFDDRQRLNYLSLLSGPELTLASSRPGIHTQVWCALQIGVPPAALRFYTVAYCTPGRPLGYALPGQASTGSGRTKAGMVRMAK